MMRWTGWRFDRLRSHFEGNTVAITVAAIYYYSYVVLMQFMHFNILTAILISGYQSLRTNMTDAHYRGFQADAGWVVLHELVALRRALRAACGRRRPGAPPLPWTQTRCLRDIQHLVTSHPSTPQPPTK